MTTIHQILVVDGVVIASAMSNILSEGWQEIDESRAAQVSAFGIGRALWVDDNVVAYTPPAPPAPVLTRLAKAELWRRATDAEAEAMDAALAEAPLRLRRLFEAASYLDTSDADYPALRAGIIAAIGETRADEILAPAE